jgi:hypothetical protein
MLRLAHRTVASYSTNLFSGFGIVLNMTPILLESVLVKIMAAIFTRLRVAVQFYGITSVGLLFAKHCSGGGSAR